MTVDVIALYLVPKIFFCSVRPLHQFSNSLARFGCLQAFRAVVGRQYRLVNYLDVVSELPTFNDYVAVGNGTGLYATNGSVYLQERPDMPVKSLTWDDHSCALYQGNLLRTPAARIPAAISALGNVALPASV